MKSNTIQKTGNLKNDCGKKLLDLKVNISSADKFDAIVKFKLSRPTLEKYLGGEVPKLNTGCDLLEFFTERVNRSKSVIANA